MYFSRNIGLISHEQQQQLNNASVLIAGVGGMGGIAAEVLVRMGVGKIKLCDFDIYEEVNFNRQIHSNIHTLGQYKVDVLKKEFLAINPQLQIEVFKEAVSLSNIEALLTDVDIVINGMDKMHASLILERTARLKRITIVDAWITPYASVFVMTPDSPHWEDFLDLPTKDIPLDQITEQMCQQALKKEIDYTFSHFEPYNIIEQSLVKDIISDVEKRPSLAPVVWLSGVLMANEVLKILTEDQATDHVGIFYNQYSHQTIRGNLHARYAN